MCIQYEFCVYNLGLISKFMHSFDTSLNHFKYYIFYELFCEIVECVQYLHSRDPSIIHRLLSPQNILIKINNNENGRFVKLCALSFAVQLTTPFITHTLNIGNLVLLHQRLAENENIILKRIFIH